MMYDVTYNVSLKHLKSGTIKRFEGALAVTLTAKEILVKMSGKPLYIMDTLKWDLKSVEVER